MKRDIKEDDVEKSEKFIRKNEFDEALIYFEKEYRDRHVHGKLGDAIHAHIYFCKHLILIGRYLEVIPILEEYLHEDDPLNKADGSLEGFSNLEGEIYHTLGEAYFESGSYYSALECLDYAYDIKEGSQVERLSIANSALEIAKIYTLIGDHDQALYNLYRAMPVFRAQFLKKDDYRLGLSYIELSRLHWFNDELGLSAKFLSNGEECFREIQLGSDHFFMARIKNMKGLIQWKKAKNRKGKNRKGKNRESNNKKLFDWAIGNFESGIKIMENIFPAGRHPFLAILYNNKGIVSTSKDHKDDAESCYNKALEIFRITTNFPHPHLGRIHIDIAFLWKQRKNYEKSLEHYQWAIYYVVSGFDKEDISYFHRNPVEINLNKVTAFRELLSAFLRKAEIFLKLFERDHSIVNLTYASNTLEKAFELLEQLAEDFLQSGSRFFYEKRARKLFEYYLKAYDYQVKHGLLSNHIATKKAFKKAEFIRSLAILEDIQEKKTMNEIMSKNLNKHYKNIKAIIRTKHENVDGNNVEGWDESEFLKIGFKDRSFFLNDYERRIYLDSYPQKAGLPGMAIEVIQEKLINVVNGAILSYFVGEEDIFVFLISSGYSTFLNLTPDKNKIIYESIIEGLQELSQLIRIHDYEDFEKGKENYVNIAFQLHQQLMKPLENYLTGIKQLFILPDGALSQIPFEALLYKPAKEHFTFNDLNYLLKKDFVISYHYSIITMVNRYADYQHDMHDASQEYDFIGFAPVEFSDSNLPDLPMSKGAMLNLKRLFNRNNLKKIKTFLYNEAVIPKYLRNASKSRIIHIISHITDSACIHFYGEKEEAELRINDVISLPPLNADLVFICGCSSGPLNQQSDKISLSRAYTIAKARNVICTIFEILDSDLTHDLVYRFYKEVLKGASYSMSLKRAKLKALEEELSAFPNYWAGFIFIGDQMMKLNR